MFGFVVGTLCLVGLFGLFHGRHRYHVHHHPYGWGRHDGWGRPDGHRGEDRQQSWRGPRFVHEGFGRAAAEVVKRRLRLDEDQADIVDHAARDVRAAVGEYVETLKGSRAELSAAFRGETVDEAAIAAVFDRHDEDLVRARREVVSAFKQIHAVLTDEQRKIAADWIGSADPRWV